ncbi:unnamed protein product [Musa acuminata subsp. malaccensis]|uniref:(wild Malaysian banana) hypothetical protein n=1 Tax=Musa acuminata subsp. malaccensis TaxID=214687 RepID=A0A804K1M3_MUSAM|nr:PREDICTED: cation/H(+) antiporter 15-like [Musa acuminata subsp. malaccensis]CAG1830246.1 unnamed protein product [Musa acuminata subsp. malaccensis]
MATYGAEEQAACIVAKPFSNGVFYHEEPLRDAIPLFMLQIIITVLTSRIIYFLLRPLRQPRIVCDIIGGILLGHPILPSLLSRLPFFPRGTFDHLIRNYTEMLFRRDALSLTRTMAAYGVMLKFFLIGVKIDPRDAWRCGKKAFFIGFCSMMVPFVVLLPFGRLFKSREYVREDKSTISVVDGIGQASVFIDIAATVSASSPPVLADILTELRLLNTELGRLAMSASMVNELTRWTIFAVFPVVQLSWNKNGVIGALLELVTSLAIVISVFVMINLWMRWIVRRTPKGGRIGEVHILMVMLAVLAMGVMSDAFGLGFMDAPLIMGLLVPDGPPLGMALVERLELISTEVLLPVFFLGIGWATDFASIHQPVPLLWLLLFMLAGHVVKVLVAVAPAVYSKSSIRNAAVLGLMLNFKGLVELMVYLNLKNVTALNPAGYVAVVVGIVIATAISSLLVSILYDPLSSSGMVGNRTLQHLKPHEQFCFVASVLNEGPVPMLLNLVEVSCADEQSSVCAYVLHLVELGGRASSSLIAHRNHKDVFVNLGQMDRVHNAFINVEKKKEGVVVVHPFTAISPYATMHQDICSLAMEKKVPFIIVPYPRKDSGGSREVDQAARSIIPQVLSQAPCSVGVLIHQTLTSSRPLALEHFNYCVRVLFWGGNDDREALAYTARLARHAGVRIFVSRFMPQVHRKEEKEMTWDDMIFKEFTRANADNERVAVEEIAVNDVNQMISTIRSIEMECDLVIVGRRQCSGSLLDEALSEWTESPELGVVGDMLASSDFANYSFSVLVVQQHGS